MTAKLELKRADFFPWLFANDELAVTRLSATSYRFAQFLWDNIGQTVDDRGGWTAADWQNHLANPEREFYAVYCDGEPAGCCELRQEPRLMRARATAMRINAFGLLPEFSGEGLGAALLTRMIEKSFASGATRVTISSSDQIPESMLALCRRQGFQVLTSHG